ncbi:hypothetical protein GO730_27240 [Spirosoma sp. HMF3257]|uniref:Uncharacterized protein n=1 Tax=Spirosoma telluris TaxID=2183553 RepID=A0A327NNB8_9BACT|nr:hypothetical protein [Spirosoma telluris]RAI76941.1 hypothetical protein HMF3257_27165 [Spirosoma telluris]
MIVGFYYMTFRNSPKYANIWLLIVVICIGISYIQPREDFSLVAVGLGIVGLFVVAIQSRNVREDAIQKWFSANGFKRVTFSAVEPLFNTPAIGTINYYPYIGEVINHREKIPFVMVIRYASSNSNNTVSIILDCSYYFNGKVGTDVLEQKFKTARENTPHTDLWKSHMRFFDLKDCEILKPAMGGIVVSWRVPDTVEGYSDRYEWIKDALQH